MLEDRLLIWKLNRGDLSVLRRIYQKYKHDLATLAAALLNDKSAAEDAVHDTFVDFIEAARRFRLTGSLRGYLATCVANNARNRNKAKQRRHVGLGQADDDCSSTYSPDVSAMFGEELQRLSRSLGQLPYEQREVIMLLILLFCSS